MGVKRSLRPPIRLLGRLISENVHTTNAVERFPLAVVAHYRAFFHANHPLEHVETPTVMRRELDWLSERQSESVEALTARVRFPTVTSTDELEIDLGGLHVRVFPTPGHSSWQRRSVPCACNPTW